MLLELPVPCYHAAYARAAGAEALGYGVYYYGVFGYVVKLAYGFKRLAAVYKFAVHLVAYKEEAVLLGDIRHQP